MFHDDSTATKATTRRVEPRAIGLGDHAVGQTPSGRFVQARIEGSQRGCVGAARVAGDGPGGNAAPRRPEQYQGYKKATLHVARSAVGRIALVALNVEVLADLVDARFQQAAHLAVQALFLLVGEPLVDEISGR